VVAALDARVVRIQNMQPGAFLGFESDGKNSEFNSWFHAMMSDIKWCCSTQILELKQQRHDSLDFPQPLPFSTHQQTQFSVRYILYWPVSRPVCGFGVSGSASLCVA
jgi:hypothetical protein